MPGTCNENKVLVKIAAAFEIRLVMLIIFGKLRLKQTLAKFCDSIS
jgi:hypothetical protein